MAEIHIHREHRLGLARARKVALQWAEQAEEKFDMECTIFEGEASDTVEFTRAGVKGELRVEAHQFTLDATLGFLLGAFSKTIEAEIEKTLDALLDNSSPAGRPAGNAKIAAAKGKAPAKKPGGKGVRK